MTIEERRAISRAIQALNDWVVTYAPEWSDENRVRESAGRICDKGGTLAYATDVREELERCLKDADECHD